MRGKAHGEPVAAMRGLCASSGTPKWLKQLKLIKTINLALAWRLPGLRLFGKRAATAEKRECSSRCARFGGMACRGAGAPSEGKRGEALGRQPFGLALSPAGRARIRRIRISAPFRG